jgi:hypothetical protein
VKILFIEHNQEPVIATITTINSRGNLSQTTTEPVTATITTTDSRGNTFLSTFSGARKGLVSAFLWCQQFSGVSISLVPGKLWCQKRVWCQERSGVSLFLVPAFLWRQYFPGARKGLVSDSLWGLIGCVRSQV